MKQNYLKELMTALLLLCCTVVSAQVFEVDGIYYNILSEEDKTVEVTSGSNKYTGAVTIPASVTYNSTTYSVIGIGDVAFAYCSGLTSVEIPSSVTSIGSSAFYDCDGLTSIEIPSSVTSIGERAFYYCYGLTSIVVDEGNSVYDSRGNCNAIIETASNTLIAGCVNTIIPEGVTSIGESAFEGCSILTIEIPASVTSIGIGAFWSCYSLTSINIPAGVTSIGYGAFRGCTGLTSIVVGDGNSVYDSRGNCNAII
ncbi:MAG: leucine-rich repeat domain-containing protein, partial [Bacteroidaceae bacterium]|nr:leucine-rich repeat domain-containing protein [Bacteroidaceae bacterium]